MQGDTTIKEQLQHRISNNIIVDHEPKEYLEKIGIKPVKER
jgi:hypothetical protein